ncbi:MAG: peptidyl-prolyl cis-trans isomerase [Planctomycetota bacterium]
MNRVKWTKDGRTLLGWLLSGVAIAVAAQGQEPSREFGAFNPASSPASDLNAATSRPKASIVARIDDQVILLEEVMLPIQGQLKKLKAQMPKDKYREAEWHLLSQVTKARIQRTVLLKELELMLPNANVLPKVRKAAHADFEKYLLKLARDAGLKDRDAMLAKIEQEGSNLDALREDFIDNMLAQQYLHQTIKSQIKEPTRDELFEYYQQHQDEFTEPVGAEWRHIQVKKGNGAAAARKKIEDLHRQLLAGGDFAKIAEKESDGPTARTGGKWTLTSKGSYAEAAVDDAIFTMKVGEISPVIEGSNAFHIVRVEKRNDGSATPFSEVVDEITQKLNNQLMTNLRKSKIEEAMKKHYIESIFDNAPSDLEQAEKNKNAIKR